MTMGGNASQKVWLVTGCSSGLGRSFVRAIVARGDIAVATARDPETLRLVLGADAWEVYTQTTQAHIAAMEPWVEKSRQTAFPPDAL